MAKPERQQQVLELLKGLKGLEPLKQLFWSELNYQRVNEPLSRRGWPEPATKALADDPVLFASGGDGGAFHIIYCRLTSRNLARSLERPVVAQLLREHPYALFIFSDKSQTDWHFLNVKFDDQAGRRQLYRRITVRPGAGLRTATERVQLLDLAEIHPELFGITPLAIQQRCDAAFDVETVTKDFFTEVANWYFWALKNAKFPKDAPKEADGQDHISIIRLITRLIFCWFVKEKGLIPDTLFDQQKLAAILTGFEPAKASAKQSVFYKAILQNLFFATLNTEMDKRAWRKDDANFMAHILYRHKTLFHKPGEALALFKDIPFLNGGLFECLDKREGTPEKPKDIRIDGFSDRSDSQPTVPDFLFFGAEREVDLSKEYGDKKSKSVPVQGLIRIFNRYNFTVEEDTPIDQEVALDPELSGKVFENLLAAYNPETGATARKQTGSFYTPREIVNYMVDESLIACLKTKLETALPAAKDVETRLRQLFAYTDEPQQFTAPEVDALIAAIDSLKTLDPAVGSGAFPMGILHKLVFILGKLDSHNEKWKERQIQRVRNTIKEAEKTEDAARRDKMVGDLEEQIAGINEAFRLNELNYGRKLYLIENCIYGVDIQPIAVQIAKMRFFISLIVDQKIDDKQPNRGVLPLPNLETKFVAANTLIGIERPDTQGKLFSNDKVEKLKSELSRIRHRLFTAKRQEDKRNLREKDKAVREALAGEIQKSLVRANEDEISKTSLELEKVHKTLEEEQSKPAQWETQRITNLFGEVEETRIDTTKDKKIRLKEQIKQMESKILRASQRDADIDAIAHRLASWNPYDQNASTGFFDSEWMFGITDGFDVVIGNPPYVRIQNIEENEAEILKHHYCSAIGKFDVYVLFVENAFRLISAKGIICLIHPHRFLTADYGRGIKAFLDKVHGLHWAILFGVDQVFDSATTYTGIFAYSNDNAGFGFKHANTTEFYLAPFTQRPYSESGSHWNLSTENASSSDLIEKLRGQPRKLSDICIGVFQGIVTVGDDIFVFKGKRSGKTFIGRSEAADKEVELEAEMVKPLLKGENIQRYEPLSSDIWIFYPHYQDECGKTRAYSETEMRARFPKAFNYIKPFKSHLVAKKKQYKTNTDLWFSLHRSREMSLFEQPKILTPQLQNHPSFAFDENSWYPDAGGYSLILKNATKDDYMFLLGVMNSSLLWYFIQSTSNPYNNSYYYFKTKYLEPFSLPAVDKDKQLQIAKLAEKIHDAKIAPKRTDTTGLEREINQQVYALYSLTPEEIDIVEAASPFNDKKLA